MTAALQACRSALGDRYNELYYALLYSAPQARAQVLAVHAVARELARAARASAEPALGQVKLQWWREQLERAAGGRAEHPLLVACAGTGLDWTALLPLADAAGEDTRGASFVDPDAVHRHLDLRHGPLGRVTARVLGCADAATPDAMARLATAAAHARALVMLGAQARTGRACVAREDLDRFGLAGSDLHGAARPARLDELAALLHERAVRYHRDALAAIPRADRTVQLPGRALAAYEFTRLAETARAGYKILDRRVELTPLRLLWIAWREQRRG